MDQEIPEVLEDEVVQGDTPEDVAVLYSWANLQGAKYRDFSASRREYRAQMRHQAAEAQRLEEIRLLQEAEHAAAAAELEAREAEEEARVHESAVHTAVSNHHMGDAHAEEAARERALRHAAEMSRIAAAERIEAARRSEAVAAAEAAARREEREMEEARASAERQAARYAESEIRMRELAGPQPSGKNRVPGQISDPYQAEQQTLPGRIFHQPSVPDDDMLPSRHTHQREVRLIVPQPDPTQHSHTAPPVEYLGLGTVAQDAEIAARGTQAIADAAKKPHSPVHYYEPDSVETAAAVDEYARYSARKAADRAVSSNSSITRVPVARSEQPLSTSSASHPVLPTRKMSPYADPVPGSPRSLPTSFASSAQVSAVHLSAARLAAAAAAPREPLSPREPVSQREVVAPREPMQRRPLSVVPVDEYQPAPLPVNPLSVVPHEAPAPVQTRPAPVAYVEPPPALPRVATPAEISQGQLAYAKAKAEAQTKAEAAQAAFRRARGYAPDEASGFFAAYGSERVQAAHVEAVEPAVPAWLAEPHASSASVAVAKSLPVGDSPSEARRRAVVASSATAPGESLQNSRERVASRWYALKGVFDHTVQEQKVEDTANPAEKTVPLVAVFSLAGGVGKTSLVATLGRSLSATGEKVLLTDTTSHGLLPFYFGASELRPGVMRTFSPPSGSSDAPIYLVAYDVMQKNGDASSQEWFTGELNKQSKDMARVVLDLSSCSPWVARRLARMDATVIIPVAPDMNSVISLGPVEKFFADMKDSHGNPVEPFYLLNGFDATLPLHLDVREVMRRQLDDRLLPFVIRRASTVPEALAEGMTIVDYAPESAVAEDYRNLAAWVKSRSAPATAANKTARWSER